MGAQILGSNPVAYYVVCTKHTSQEKKEVDLNEKKVGDNDTDGETGKDKSFGGLVSVFLGMLVILKF